MITNKPYWKKAAGVAAIIVCLIIASGLVILRQQQRTVGAADPRLEMKVNYSTEQASVQDIVQDLAQQAAYPAAIFSESGSLDNKNNACLFDRYIKHMIIPPRR